MVERLLVGSSCSAGKLEVKGSTEGSLVGLAGLGMVEGSLPDSRGLE